MLLRFPALVPFFTPVRCTALVRSTVLAVASLAAIAATTPTAAQAEARAAEKLATLVPADVIEVQSIGTWTEDKQTGIYRTVTIISGMDKDYAARVFVQWLAIKGDSGRAEVIATKALTEFNDMRMPQATVTIDADQDNEASIVVAAQDTDTQRDTLMLFKATKPGSYQMTAVPVSPAKLSGDTSTPASAVKN